MIFSCLFGLKRVSYSLSSISSTVLIAWAYMLEVVESRECPAPLENVADRGAGSSGENKEFTVISF